MNNIQPFCMEMIFLNTNFNLAALRLSYIYIFIIHTFISNTVN